MCEKWLRPKELSVPTIWAVVEGKKPLGNGKVARFRIQDLTPELEDEAIDHMITYFIRDEPYCAFLDLVNDEVAKVELREMYKELVKHRIALIALLDNAEELGDATLPKIAGINMTYAMFPDDKDPQLKSANFRSVFKMTNVVSHAVDCFKKYNVPVIMYAFGLSVHPIYRGYGLGEAILRTRFIMGRAVGIPLTTTVFSGDASQALSRKVGFELLSEVTPEEYEEDGRKVFKGVKSKSMQFVAARIS